MLVLDCPSLRVLQAAGDTQGLLGRSIDDLLGQTLHGLFSIDQINRLTILCGDADMVNPRQMLDPIMRVSADVPIDASAHRSGDCLVVEFEAAEMMDPFVLDPLSAVQEMVEGFGTAPSLYALCQLATASVRRVAQYDRVMVYRFMADGSGVGYR